MKHALVTGASGFIGRHLVKRLLRDGVFVRALARNGSWRLACGQDLQVVEGDVEDPQAMRTAAVDCDTVFHLAAKVHALSDFQEDEAVYRSVNVEGTRNLLEGAVSAGARRFVYFSSVKAMGEEASWCLDESMEARPVTAYGRSKLAAECLVLDYGKRFGLHVVCLRLPLVYGPGNKGNLFRMISAIDRGLFPPLPKSGSCRSMVHVANVVDAALLVATNPMANGQRYIVTDARAYSTRELYEVVCRGLGKCVPHWSIPMGILKAMGYVGDAVGWIRGKRFLFDSDALEKLLGPSWYSSDKISRELAYRPSVAFEDSLPELIDWYQKART